MALTKSPKSLQLLTFLLFSSHGKLQFSQNLRHGAARQDHMEMDLESPELMKWTGCIKLVQVYLWWYMSLPRSSLWVTLSCLERGWEGLQVASESAKPLPSSCCPYPPCPKHQPPKHHLPMGPPSLSCFSLPLLCGLRVLNATVMQFSTCVTTTLHHSLIILCKARLHSWVTSVCNICCLFVCCLDVPGDNQLLNTNLPRRESNL